MRLAWGISSILVVLPHTCVAFVPSLVAGISQLQQSCSTRWGEGGGIATAAADTATSGRSRLASGRAASLLMAKDKRKGKESRMELIER